MISVNRRTLYGEVYNDVRCLSSDEKPTEGIKNGSTLIEIDTGARYLFDASNGQWNEFSQGGGGGGEYVLPTMSSTTKGGATVGEGLTMDGTALSVDYSEVASVDALEEATALSPTGGIVSTQDGLAISPEQSSTGAIDGSLLELTAKSKPATQQTTTGKNLLPSIASRTVASAGTTEPSTSRVLDGTVLLSGIGKSGHGRTSYVTSCVVSGESITFTNTNPSYGVGIDASVSPNTAYTASISDESTCVMNVVGYDSDGVRMSIIASGNLASFTTPEGCAHVMLVFSSDAAGTYKVVNPQLELGSTATPYEPYSGGAPSPSPDYPQPIVTVRGRNLIDESNPYKTDYYINENGVETQYNGFNILSAKVYSHGQYTLSFSSSSTATSVRVHGYDKNGQWLEQITIITSQSLTKTFEVQDGIAEIRVSLVRSIHYVQLTLGSTPQPYVPYGHVGLERRDLQGTLLDTTPIPLPSRGWVAGLPDGTADELTVDGAGKVVWTELTEENVIDENTTVTNRSFTQIQCRVFFANNQKQKPFNNTTAVDTDILSNYFMPESNNGTIYGYIGVHRRANGLAEICLSWGTGYFASAEEVTTWLSTHPVTVLYPLATPVTENCGYVDLPSTQDCVLSIPELDALGVRYTIGDGAEIARQWYARAMSELEETQDAIVDLAAEVTTHEGRITVTEGRLDALQSLRKGADGYYVNETVTSWLARKFDGKIYGYSEPKTTATAVTKTGANAGLPNPTLGTLTERGESVYRDIGPTQWYAAKGYVDSDGVPHVKVIRGVDSQGDWDACTDNVWSLRPVVYYSVDESGVSVNGQLSDTWHVGMKPNPRAYLPDGTMRPYMLSARHALAFEGGVGVSKPGLKGYGRNVSHDSLITLLDYADTGYSGKTEYEQWYENFMLRIIYGTKHSQGIMMGCASYNLQYHPTVAETGVKRVILSNANAANLLVGSTMMMGNQATASTDRNNANCYNVFDGLVISSIETYDSANKAVYLDTDETFDTDPAYLLSTAPWHTGSCGDMDWDGTPTNAGKTSGNEPMFFQGCELMNGNYEVLGDVILSSDGETGWIPYVNEDTKNEATSVTSDYVSCVTSLPVDDSDSWKYPLYLSERNGLMYGIQTGGSQTVGVCDGHYINKRATTGLREWLSFGTLYSGGFAGLACVNGYYGLGSAYWHIWSRLSGVGRSKLSA